MSDCPIGRKAQPSVFVARYLRRPDAAFWRDLFRLPPPSTEADMARRFRIARYALGGATLSAILYAAPLFFFDQGRLTDLLTVNTVAGLLFAFGMWMASLAYHRLARGILMVTLSAQIAVLVWLGGSQLMVVAYAPVIVALASVTYAFEEIRQRVAFIAIGVFIFIAGMALWPAAHVDFSRLPTWTTLLMRGLNALVAVVIVAFIIITNDNQLMRREAELVVERERSDHLLDAVLPTEIVARLREQPGAIADRHADVTVLFADIVGFTPWSSTQTPEDVVSLLEKIFSRFDQCVLDAGVGVEKIKTIGDAYMVICGAPTSRDGHAGVIAALALDMMQQVDALSREVGHPFQLRVGIHSGSLIAGVIGVMRFSYDVWGDTVNTASRMESHSEPGRIQISSDTHQLLDGSFHVERRGIIDVKGKGEMETWWLIGRKAS
jgi:class 3 adenylate cyclase